MIRNRLIVCVLFYVMFFATLLGFSFAQTCDGVNTAFCNNIVSVTIYNSYSGNVQFSSSLGFVYTGSNVWVSGSMIPLEVRSTKQAQYIISGTGITMYSGLSFSGINNEIGVTMTQEGLNSAVISFDSSGEFFSGNSLIWMHDVSAPTVPNQLGPLNNSVIGGSAVNIGWTASIETGVGFSGYVLELSLDGNRSNAVKISLGSVTQYALDLVGMPIGTYFWRVKSIDLLGNTSISTPGFFHVGAPSGIGSSSNGPVGGNQGSYDVLIHDPNKSINPQQTPGCLVATDGIICQSTVVGTHNSSTVALDSKKSLIGNQMNQHLKGLDRTKIKLPGILPKSGVEVDPEPFEKLISEQTHGTICSVSNNMIWLYILLSFLLGFGVGLLAYRYYSTRKRKK